MTGWRTALRVARREAVRARGRSALIVSMIVLPVAAIAFGAVTMDTFTLTPSERADRLMGSAQAAVIWQHNGPVHQLPDEPLFLPVAEAEDPIDPTVERLLALLPPGSRAIEDQTARVSVHTTAGIGSLHARMLDYADPLTRGILRPLSGRAPAAADEVSVTPAAARRLGTGLGGTVRLAGNERTLRVVGTVEDPSDLRSPTLILPAGVVEPQDVTWLVATPQPLTWAQVKTLNTHGIVAISRHVLTNPPSEQERYPAFATSQGPPIGPYLLIGGLAMLEIVLLAGSAFVVGARRRRRDLALVAACGGTPAHLRRIVLADGVVAGVVSAVAGLALGVATAAASRPLVEEYLTHERSEGLRVFPAALVVLAGLAVTAGTLAALVPAWIASHQDVAVALAGRRGITRSRRRWVLLGAGLVGVGAVAAAVGAWRTNEMLILSGAVAVQLGLVLCTPAIVGLVTRLGRFLPVAPRIALRDTSRNRTAAAPAVAAVMAAVIGSLAIAVVLTADDKRARENYRSLSPQGTVFVFHPHHDTGGDQASPPADVASALRGSVPVKEIHEIRGSSCGGAPCLVTVRTPAGRACPFERAVLKHTPTRAEQRAARRDARCDGVQNQHSYFGGAVSSDAGMSPIIEPEAAGALVDMPPGDTDRVMAALRAGAVVVDDPRYVENGQVTLEIETGRKGEVQTVTVPGFALPHRPGAPIILIPSQTARALGVTPSPLVTLASTTRMPTVDEQDRLLATLASGFDVTIEQVPEPDNGALLLLAIIAALTAIGAAAVATGLAAAEGRADLATLAAVGASPRLRRLLSLSQAGVISGLGSLLGTVAGLGAAMAVLAAINRGYANAWPAPTPYPITVPWLNVGIVLLAAPLVAMLGAGLFTRSRLPIERRR